MLIYRIENKIGWGPYQRGILQTLDKTLYEIILKHNYTEDHPSIVADLRFNFGRFDENYYCGFLTLKQCEDWFTLDTIKMLYGCGFNINVYKCSFWNVIKTKSKRQLAFLKGKATLVKKIDLEIISSNIP